MKNDRLADYVTAIQSGDKWELVAYLMSDMLEDFGVDTTKILEADKDEVARMLLEYGRKRRE